MRAARALAAFEAPAVTEEQVKRVSAMALRHRLRRDALDETATSEQIQQAVDEVFPSTAAAAVEWKRWWRYSTAGRTGQEQQTSTAATCNCFRK